MTNLKRARLEREIRQKDLARKAKIRQPLLSELESGKLRPGPAIAERLAAALNVPADWIMSR